MIARLPFSWFTTTAHVGALTKSQLESGSYVLTMLSLQVAGEPGTYTVSLIDGHVIDAALDTLSLEAGTALEITVKSE